MFKEFETSIKILSELNDLFSREGHPQEIAWGVASLTKKKRKQGPWGGYEGHGNSQDGPKRHNF